MAPLGSAARTVSTQFDTFPKAPALNKLLVNDTRGDTKLDAIFTTPQKLPLVHLSNLTQPLPPGAIAVQQQAPLSLDTIEKTQTLTSNNTSAIHGETQDHGLMLRTAQHIFDVKNESALTSMLSTIMITIVPSEIASVFDKREVRSAVSPTTHQLLGALQRRRISYIVEPHLRRADDNDDRGRTRFINYDESRGNSASRSIPRSALAEVAVVADAASDKNDLICRWLQGAELFEDTDKRSSSATSLTMMVERDNKEDAQKKKGVSSAGTSVDGSIATSKSGRLRGRRCFLKTGQPKHCRPENTEQAASSKGIGISEHRAMPVKVATKESNKMAKRTPSVSSAGTSDDGQERQAGQRVGNSGPKQRVGNSGPKQRTGNSGPPQRTGNM